MEIWKQINNLHYSISNLGNVRNDNTNKLLKPQKNIYGYLVILLYDNGKPLHCQIHRLVLMAFNPVDNMENLQVNHIDHNRENNKLNNLEWTTAKENCSKKKLRKFYNSKGCYDNFGNYFSSYREAGRYYGISANTVKNDCLRNNKTNRNISRKKKTSHISQINFLSLFFIDNYTNYQICEMLKYKNTLFPMLLSIFNTPKSILKRLYIEII